MDSDPPPPPPTLDSVLAKLGNPGKYQVSVEFDDIIFIFIFIV